MIVSQDQTLIVSNIAYTDGGCLWLLDTRRGRVSTRSISRAVYLSLIAGASNHFAVVHHSRSDRLRVSVHTFADPTKPLADLTMDPNGTVFEGDATAWGHVPRAYITFVKLPAFSDYCLLLIDRVGLAAEIVRLDWFNDSYDKLYQSVIGLVEVPDDEKVIISVQRDSHPVLFDLTQRKAISKLSLVDGGGNPTLRFTRRPQTLWADDYDTIVRLSPTDWHVMDSLRLQGASNGTRQFIGDFSFNQDESLCIVARPFSGDAVALNTKKFKITHRCKLERQPLKVCALSDGTVYARDWKTGDLLKGELKRKWLF